MNRPNQYLEASIHDIIFENRNKQYGAYYLRTHEQSFILRALGITVLLTVLFSVYALWVKRDVLDVNPIVIIASPKDFPDLLKNFELKQPELPPVKQAVSQPTVRYTEMRVVEDSKPINSETTAIGDLKDRIISTQTNKVEPGIKGIVSNPKPETPPVKTTSEIFKFAEVTPEFIGGFAAMQKYIAEHIEFPIAAKNYGIDGTVYVSMVVNTDGSVSQVKVERGIGYGLDEAATEVVAAMPKWKPGMQNQQVVRVQMVIPIQFKLLD